MAWRLRSFCILATPWTVSDAIPKYHLKDWGSLISFIHRGSDRSYTDMGAKWFGTARIVRTCCHKKRGYSKSGRPQARVTLITEAYNNARHCWDRRQPLSRSQVINFIIRTTNGWSLYWHLILSPSLKDFGRPFDFISRKTPNPSILSIVTIFFVLIFFHIAFDNTSVSWLPTLFCSTTFRTRGVWYSHSPSVKRNLTSFR